MTTEPIDDTTTVEQVRDEDATMKAINTEFGGVTGDLGATSMQAKSRRLSFTGMGTHVTVRMLPDGQKALAPSGATIVGQEFVRDPVALGQVAQSLLDVLPTKQHTSTEYAYLRQTVRHQQRGRSGRGYDRILDHVQRRFGARQRRGDSPGPSTAADEHPDQLPVTGHSGRRCPTGHQTAPHPPGPHPGTRSRTRSRAVCAV